MYYKFTSFLVIGLKKSGVSATKLLLSKGAEVFVYDDAITNSVKTNLEELIALGAKKLESLENAENNIDVLVLSPAVPIDCDIAVKFRENGKKIIGELELGSYFINSPIVGVTGTNGKTSVCSIVSHVLSNSNVNNVLVGNIGTPITSKLNEITDDTVVVTEVSSYQLETTYRFLPHIACVLNLTEDHLTRHYTMENYAYVKSKILLNLTESEFAVLNYDDNIVKQMEESTNANVTWFSTREVVDGAYLKGNVLYFYDEQIINVNDLNVSGEHNVSDVLASVCILRLLGVAVNDITNGLKTFKGVKHRIELVREYNDISFYNDSKATNVDATIKAINSMKKSTVLILGGYDKGLSYLELMKVIKASEYIKKVVLTGASSKKMFDDAISENVCEVSVITDFTLAVRVAYRLAEKNWNVLLSPATSSFDEFTSFEERGEKFIEIVNSL